MVKAPYYEKVELKRGKWTIEEDELLVKYIQANGEGSWRSLPKNAGLLRCGKSCRLRWINYLRPNLKRGKFTPQEDETIVKLHSSLGNRWSLIAQHLSGKTDNEIKNYWNSHLSRRIYTFRNLKDLSKTAANVPKVVADGGGDCDESSRKQRTTTESKGGSFESLLSKNHTVDICSIRKSNSSCHGGKDNVTWSEGGSAESFLVENIEINSSCPGGKDDVMWSEGVSVESFLEENIEINSSCPGGKDDVTWPEGGSVEYFFPENIKINSSCPGGKNDVTWSEGGSVESFLVENIKINSSCPGGKDDIMRSEGGSVESFLVENIEINSSCPEGKDRAMWSEEGSSIESLLTKNYIVDLEFLTQSLSHEIKGLAMQQHDEETKTHESRNEDKDNKHIHGQQIQLGPHEVNEVVLQQQHNECLHDFDDNWFDIDFDYFLEEQRVYTLET